MSMIELSYKKLKHKVVCQGTGDSEEGARDNAAANTLHYLANIKKKKRA